ncbi:hypothetical protein NQ317_000636 [Molorchus minor]|uniref:Peptidase A2 domain-containing protein n=1 Tax=Molorchus minor TaxID=1323400 RepID=A0ABQ9JIN7_9CUCU|nr:hypothetical protein NQ317_000636 [Molorchus minor]
MSNADKLKRAKNLRTVEINRMQELVETAQLAQTNSSFHSQFKQRYQIIDNIQEVFNKYHNAIFNYLPVEADEEYEIEDKVRTKFDKQYFATKTVYYDLFEKNQVTRNEEPDLPRPKLPELKLIKFNGDIKHFTSFVDVFDALVHNNSQLSNIEKFSHLLACLEGQPKNLVQTHPLTSANYIIAYNALKSRYSNKRLLATFHWNEVENAPRLTHENPPAIRKLLDIFTENIAALTNLGFPVDQWDFILTHMLLKRLDPTLICRFETQYGSTEMPSFQTLKEFISKQCTAYETISSSSASFNPRSKNYSNDRSKNNSQNAVQRSSSFLTAANQNNNNNRPCILCNTSDHVIYGCPLLLNKPPYERFNLIKQRNLCVNCLSHTHSFQNCNSTSTCKTCHQRHHTLLHFTRNTQQTPPLRNISRISSEPSTSSQMSSPSHDSNNDNPRVSHAFAARNEIAQACPASRIYCDFGNVNKSNTVLLSTVKLNIRDSFGNFQTIRAILDSGSEACYIAKRQVQRLGFKITQCCVNIVGLGGMNTTTSGEVTSTIKPLNRETPMYDINLIVLDKICSDMPAYNLDISKWTHIKNLTLADPDFNISSPIDMILGANIYYKILIDGQIPALTEHLPTAINTTFGYVLLGEICDTHDSYSINSLFSANDFERLDNTVRQFWNLEEIPQQIIISPENNQCEKYYSNTTFRLDSGRYVVSLPFIDNNLPEFENSRLPALRRFYSLERRLMSDTVTFGISCSPYLALRTIMQLANDEKSTFELAANVLLSDIYIDDIVTGCNSVADAIKLQSDLILLLKRGGFELRKWASNNPELLSNLPQDIIYNNTLFLTRKLKIQLRF